MKTSTLEIPSNPESVRLVESFLGQIARRYEISAELFPNILISLTEAVNNAIHHGNGCSEHKCVQLISIHKENDRLVFQVKDEGAGFDPASIPDPTLDENCGKEGGRGVFLMKELSDHMTYHDDGRVVEIHFKVC